MLGSVKWFSPQKGFGFITREDGVEVFVHWKQVRAEGFKTLQDGEKVDFEVSEGPKGLQAEDVRVIE